MDTWRWLADLLSPREAEAKIVGHPEAMAHLRRILSEAEGAGEELPRRYGEVIRRAEAVPQTVEIERWPGLSERYGHMAEYWPGQQRIGYDPQAVGANLDNPLIHELLHFLNSLLPEPYTESRQHQVIGTMLGTATYKPAEALRGYRGLADPETQRIWQEWLTGGPPR
jgi:hypothetical protein